MTMNFRTRLLGTAAAAFLMLGIAGPRHADLLNQNTTVVRHAKAGAYFLASQVKMLAGDVESAVCLQERAARLVSASQF